MKNLCKELSFRVRLLMLLTGLLFIVNLPLFYMNNRSFQADHEEINRSQSFRFEATQFLFFLKDLEVRHQNFILTPSVQNQADFNKSFQRFVDQVANLKRSTADNSSRQVLQNELERRLKSPLKSIEESARNRKLQTGLGALNFEESADMKEDLLKIRENVANIVHDESALFADKEKRIEQKYLDFRFLIFSLASLELAAFLFTLLTLRNEYNRQLGFGKKLQDLQTRYRTIVDHASVIFWALEKNQTFTVFEGQGVDETGLSGEQVVGKKYSDIFNDPSSQLSVEKALQGECGKQDIIIHGRWFETVYVPEVQNGVVCGVVGISVDITERRRSEEEARKSNESKSRFLANMSHEIRTPIGIISGFADLALSTPISDEEKTNFILKIKKNSELLIELVTDILDLSKIEAGKLETENREQDLHDFIRELQEVFSFKCQEKGLRFLLEIGSPLPRNIITDPMRLRQILMNLLSNALKFTSD